MTAKYNAKGSKGQPGRLELTGKITKKMAKSYHKKHSRGGESILNTH
jgi:hypothetical protein